jgi:CO/xanthine dehydrogenase FAD-binding subunit
MRGQPADCSVHTAGSLEEALAFRAEHPAWRLLAGGTDLMVDLNFGRRRPPAIIDLTRVDELSSWRQENGHVFLGAGLTYATIVTEMAAFKPLVQASRSVGSPQIRNRGTVGGNLGTASPAGDALPVLAAYDAEVVVRSHARGERSMPWHAFLTGPKKTALAPDELIIGARWVRLRGPGSFSKIGTRNAMVIAVAGLCLVIDEDGRRVSVALGSVGPTILRATPAEQQMAAAMQSSSSWEDPSITVPDQVIDEFGELVAAAAKPLDDVRGTAAYRRHGCRVLARRAITWALDERRLPAWL